MAKKIGQARWFGENSENNWPRGVTLNNFRTGTIFHRSQPIVQLGVQTLPGTKFYINSSATPVIIGATGIYNLNLEGLTSITSILFDNNSLATIEKNTGAYIIVDYIYETE